MKLIVVILCSTQAPLDNVNGDDYTKTKQKTRTNKQTKKKTDKV